MAAKADPGDASWADAFIIESADKIINTEAHFADWNGIRMYP